MKRLKNIISIFCLTLFGGFLGALGGSDYTSKGMRRVLIPLLLASQLYNSTQNLWSILLLSMIGVLSFGYGIPGFVPGYEDEGSAIGRFWYKICRESHKMTVIMVRGTIGCLKALSLIIAPILLSNWGVYLYCSLGIIILEVLFAEIILIKGGFYITTYVIKTREKVRLFLNWEELLIFSGDVLLGLVVIYVR